MRARIGSRIVEVNWPGVDGQGRNMQPDRGVTVGAGRVDPGTRLHGASAPARYRSKLERNYANYLTGLQLSGNIVAWWYEPISFRLLGPRNFYKPDFLVWDGSHLTVVEVKGWSRSNDRSLVKIKTAAGLCPWAKFSWVTWKKGWDVREIV